MLGRAAAQRRRPAARPGELEGGVGGEGGALAAKPMIGGEADHRCWQRSWPPRASGRKLARARTVTFPSLFLMKFASFYSSRHGKNRRHTCASRMGRTRTQDLTVTRQRVANCTTRVLMTISGCCALVWVFFLNISQAFSADIGCRVDIIFHELRIRLQEHINKI